MLGRKNCLSSRVHAGAVVSVSINNEMFEDPSHLKSNGSEEKLNNMMNSAEFDEKSLTEQDNCGWANATITWSSDAQPFTYSQIADLSKSDISESFAVTPLLNAQNKTSSTELVHLVRIQSSLPNQSFLTCKAEKVARKNSGNFPSSNESHSRCRSSNSLRDRFVAPQCEISMIVGSPPNNNNIFKGDDERSSSGASSAPGSDCESDRDVDRATYSGRNFFRKEFSPEKSKNCSDSSWNVQMNGPSEVTILPNDKENLQLDNASNNSSKVVLNSTYDNNEKWREVKFYVHELDAMPSNEIQDDDDDVQTKISAAHALLSGYNGLDSLKNRIRSSIVSLLLQSTANRNYDQEESGRVVFYTTSMGVIRTTFERCRKVRKILETLMVRYEERDVFMNRGFQDELRERLGTSRVLVPQVFIGGRHLGGAEVLEQLNEIGHLRELLRPYKRHSGGGICRHCVGYKYVLCMICGGSKKSVTHKHHFSEDIVPLRCITCDESGLIRCPHCILGET